MAGESEIVPVVPTTTKGNTSNLGGSPRSWYCLTINNYTETDIDLFQDLTYFNKWIVQEEICPNTGTPHLQGFLRCVTKKRLKTIINDWKGWHWEPMKGSIRDNIKYCTKEASTPEDGRRWVRGFKLPPKINSIHSSQLYQWQKILLDKLKGKPDDRTVHWYYETEGKTGKSAFSKYLALKYNALVIGGKSNDIKYAITKWLEKQELKIVIIDVPRTSNGFVSYKAIEEVKNGLFFNSKYESGMVIFNSPHLVVFANEEPDYDSISLDRWDVQQIKRIGQRVPKGYIQQTLTP